MAIIETVRCPNCGSLAERHHMHIAAQVKTQCDVCDYLMVLSTRSGSVVEAHAPGIYSSRLYLNRELSSEVSGASGLEKDFKVYKGMRSVIPGDIVKGNKNQIASNC